MPKVPILTIITILIIRDSDFYTHIKKYSADYLLMSFFFLT
jgi:hypothetical protein